MRLSFPVRVAVKVSGDAFKDIIKSRLKNFRSREVEDAVRGVLTRMVLQAYRAALLKALPQLVTPEIVERKVTKPRMGERDTILALFKRRDDAMLTRDRDALKSIDRQLKDKQRQLAASLERRTQRALSTEQYRKRVLQVFEILTSPKNIAIWYDEQNALHYAIGDLALLDQIMTPSFMDRDNIGTSSYRKAVLWKQVEYGAGVYSTDPRRKGKPWRFGPKRGPGGFTVRGIKGVGFIQDRVGPKFENVALGFQAQLGAAIEEALSG